MPNYYTTTMVFFCLFSHSSSDIVQHFYFWFRSRIFSSSCWNSENVLDLGSATKHPGVLLCVQIFKLPSRLIWTKVGIHTVNYIFENLNWSQRIGFPIFFHCINFNLNVKKVEENTNVIRKTIMCFVHRMN